MPTGVLFDFFVTRVSKRITTVAPSANVLKAKMFALTLTPTRTVGPRARKLVTIPTENVRPIASAIPKTAKLSARRTRVVQDIAPKAAIARVAVA